LKSGKLISLLAEAGATASAKVTLTWKNDAAAPTSGVSQASPEA
jgi:hypothetical protein